MTIQLHEITTVYFNIYLEDNLRDTTECTSSLHAMRLRYRAVSKISRCWVNKQVQLQAGNQIAMYVPMKVAGGGGGGSHS